MADVITIAGDNLTVDLLLYRRDGRAGQKLVEATLAANPGLADLGSVLPVGAVLILPDRPQAARPALRQPISLFD
ncbi:tail protein X [Bosea sp. (in: a-proteobacteria)]